MLIREFYILPFTLLSSNLIFSYLICHSFTWSLNVFISLSASSFSNINSSFVLAILFNSSIISLVSRFTSRTASCCLL
ncbi:uncharacterized protein RHIMIDRAFT_74075 [Rhizopus microsporus ATCC 52813]|uniref:Uncharacterized protein n=1 Tax=Rhizopus microsporus ATCC 52813 TaxID=1340429 RepID=A0A2G4SIF0_RHIZD|nr:uncharacterized protein RHIMIDRAFT_74075 [Rhizopus microsporus ATCC 52813]PHZ08558.1 hypothetical protein RHIMIDRAFT_74075 [Rhizopus microsporus ATCC 52813]